MTKPDAQIEEQDKRTDIVPGSDEPTNLRRQVEAPIYVPLPDQRVQILLTEYHETIETLRNWDKIVFQMLSIVSGVAAAIVAFTASGGSPAAWGAVFALILFWIFSYLWQVKVGTQRILAIRAIEDELNMAGQYTPCRGAQD